MSAVFVIAEAGSNWRMGEPRRDLAMGRALIDVAVAADADAVKFQTYRSATVYAPDAGQTAYLADQGVETSINAVFEDLEMPYELIPSLAAYCASQGIEFMSTPFSVEDAASVDPHVRRHKVASYEINHLRLLQALARTGKPMIISTGGASLDEIAFALATVRAEGASDVTVLQCTASYPAPPEAANLLAIPTLRERFGVAVGLSDHTKDPLVAPLGAVALGATVIEKHYTIDRRLPGPDHPFALEPDELRAMIQGLRIMEQSLGSGDKVVQPAEEELRGFAHRAVQAVRDIAPGEVFVEDDNVALLRPGNRSRGVDAHLFDEVLGRRSRRPIARGDGVTADAIDPALER
ncbi:MAG TPA: N-acetylneuraminate synthase family protein [Candidatus Limnocylindrales bacterium]|nr:N-acetylneuraminate synthase family protein [Candidatus Limnocylindrales bacterium]